MLKTLVDFLILNMHWPFKWTQNGLPDAQNVISLFGVRGFGRSFYYAISHDSENASVTVIREVMVMGFCIGMLRSSKGH